MIRKSLIVLALAATFALPAFAKDGALSLVPANAVTVGAVKLRELRTSPLASTLFNHTDKLSTDGDAARFLAEAGLDPAKDVDFLVVATSPRTNLGGEADVLVAAEGRFNVERLSNALAGRGAVKKANYFITPDDSKSVNGERGAVAFPSSQLALAGTERAVVAALAARENGGTGFPGTSGFGPNFAKLDPNATAWAVVDVVRASRLANAPKIGGKNEALAAAVRSLSIVAFWATDTGDSLKLGGAGYSTDTETLQLLEDTIRGGLSAMRLAVKDKSPELVSVLRRFDVSRNGESVTISGSIPAGALRDLMAKKQASN